MLAVDTLRLGGLTALALVVVIAFGASVKHLAEGAIDLWGAVLVMLLAAVPMLQYALPFAGGFGATLAYHRFAGENEATAAMSGGISHRSLLVPAGVVGLGLLVVLIGLSDRAIPAFLRKMEAIVVGDISGVLQRTIERGESIELGPLLIHADRMTIVGPGAAAFDRFHLEGVLALATGDGAEGRQGYIVADRVNVWLFDDEGPDGPITTAQLEFRDVAGNWPGRSIENQGFFTERIPLPRTFREDPKYMSFSELRRLSDEPRLMPAIEQQRRALAHVLAQHALIEGVRARLRAEGSCAFTRPGGERVVVRASGLERIGADWRLTPPIEGGPISVVRAQAGLSSFTQTSDDVWLDLEAMQPGGTSPDPAASASLLLRNAITVDDTSPVGSRTRPEVAVASLSIAGSAADTPGPTPVETLLARARAETSGSGSEMDAEIRAASQKLARRTEKLRREIKSKMNERAAYSAASLLTVLTGAVVAMRRKNAMPLPVYLWSFFPALACVITIGAGQDFAQRYGDPGLALLWGGLLALASYTGTEYVKLRRH